MIIKVWNNHSDVRLVKLIIKQMTTPVDAISAKRKKQEKEKEKGNWRIFLEIKNEFLLEREVIQLISKNRWNRIPTWAACWDNTIGAVPSVFNPSTHTTWNTTHKIRKMVKPTNGAVPPFFFFFLQIRVIDKPRFSSSLPQTPFSANFFHYLLPLCGLCGWVENWWNQQAAQVGIARLDTFPLKKKIYFYFWKKKSK